MTAGLYKKRIRTLFASGKASEVQWAELLETVYRAWEEDEAQVKTISYAVGMDMEALCDAGAVPIPEMEVMEIKMERRGYQRWRATQRRLGINCGRRKRARG